MPRSSSHTNRHSRYHSVRIDAVHFCPLEEELSERRRRKHVDPATVPITRLRLLQRTVWESRQLAMLVCILKLPYMTRESAMADLARTISVLPNLHHVDLPDGVYNGDPAAQILRDELQASCLNIRKMKYLNGSETSFEMLTQHRLWSNLEIMELSGLWVEAAVVRAVFAALPNLQEVTLKKLPKVDDTLFDMNITAIKTFPPVKRMFLEDVAISTAGLVSYLSNTRARDTLSFLAISNTGISVAHLHQVLAASRLSHLSITEAVTRSLAIETPPPLTSVTLQTMHFEITSADDIGNALYRLTDSYYSYLASSLHAGTLPKLSKLYVRDSEFPQMLLLAPPAPAFADEVSRPVTPPRKIRGKFTQTLEVYTKGMDEVEWAFTSIASASPGSHHHRVTSINNLTRPRHQRGLSGNSIGNRVSTYNLDKGMTMPWVGEARKSIIMGNGYGDFLAVPQQGDEWDLAAPPSRRGSNTEECFPESFRPSTSRRDSGRSSLWR